MDVESSTQRFWLFKEEPDHYSYDRLVEDGETVWDGVTNNLALKHLRSVKKGDLALFYHTGKEKRVVGVMRIKSDPYPNPKLRDPKLVVVDVEPVQHLPRPVGLSEIKSDAKLKGFELVRLPRLSIMPVPKEIWDKILRMANTKTQ
jgi:predicted RNA-binding protein with PUA-like domain